MKYQCHQCNEIFDYSELSQDVKGRHISPCCGSSYTCVDLEHKLEWYLDKFLYINKDPKYYEYKDKYNH